MTSGIFHHVSTTSITIDRENRQRRELTGVEELAESISRIGLINPIVITRANEIVAGERRLTAVRLLGWDKVPVQYVDELDYAGLRSIELEENIKRVDLTWQDQTRALAEYHELRKSEAPEWTQAQTAAAIGLTQNYVSKQLSVAAELSNPKVAEAPKFSVARNIVERQNERKDTQAVLELRTHGDFQANAYCSQQLKAAIRECVAGPLDSDMQEALDMICLKMSRILTGDPRVKDHWSDIAGYAELIARRL